MAASDFYDVGPLTQVAVNLFNGWGYNFYRRENQLRADDRMVREKACMLLGEARASVEAAELAYRRTHIKLPTRANPFPDPDVVAAAQALERLSAGIGALEGQVRSQPAPESDRMSELFRREADLLGTLTACDQRLVGQAEMLRTRTHLAEAATLNAAAGQLADGLAAIAETLSTRRALLLSRG